MPKLYTKGMRNPYTLTLDPVRRWATVGDCGPDHWPNDNTEEHDLVTEPGFFGWPYFAGENFSLQGEKDPNAPVNTSEMNQGLKTLPPARHPQTRNGRMYR